MTMRLLCLVVVFSALETVLSEDIVTISWVDPVSRNSKITHQIPCKDFNYTTYIHGTYAALRIVNGTFVRCDRQEACCPPPESDSGSGGTESDQQEEDTDQQCHGDGTCNAGDKTVPESENSTVIQAFFGMGLLVIFLGGILEIVYNDKSGGDKNGTESTDVENGFVVKDNDTTHHTLMRSFNDKIMQYKQRYTTPAESLMPTVDRMDGVDHVTRQNLETDIKSIKKELKEIREFNDRVEDWVLSTEQRLPCVLPQAGSASLVDPSQAQQEMRETLDKFREELENHRSRMDFNDENAKKAMASATNTHAIAIKTGEETVAKCKALLEKVEATLATVVPAALGSPHDFLEGDANLKDANTEDSNPFGFGCPPTSPPASPPTSVREVPDYLGGAAVTPAPAPAPVPTPAPVAEPVAEPVEKKRTKLFIESRNKVPLTFLFHFVKVNGLEYYERFPTEVIDYCERNEPYLTIEDVEDVREREMLKKMHRNRDRLCCRISSHEIILEFLCNWYAKSPDANHALGHLCTLDWSDMINPYLVPYRMLLGKPTEEMDRETAFYAVKRVVDAKYGGKFPSKLDKEAMDAAEKEEEKKQDQPGDVSKAGGLHANISLLEKFFCWHGSTWICWFGFVIAFFKLTGLHEFSIYEDGPEHKLLSFLNDFVPFAFKIALFLPPFFIASLRTSITDLLCSRSKKNE